MPRLVSVPPPLVLALSGANLHALLAAHAAPRALLALATPAAAPLPLSAARTFFALPAADPLADALDLFTRFASAAGKRALLEAIATLSRSSPLPGIPLQAAPADLAALVLAARGRKDDPRFDGVVRRALLALAELAEPLFAYEHVAASPRRARPVAEAEPTLRAFLRELSPAWNELWIHEEEATGALSIALLSHDDASVVVAIDPAVGPAPLPHAALRFDRIDLDVAAGRVSVRTLHPHQVQAITRAVARAFFDDAAFFTDRPAFTTRPIEALGTTGLATVAWPAPVTRARVIACTKEIVGKGRERTTGSTALAILEERVHEAGYLPEVTLRFDIAGDETPVDLEIRLPGRFACSAPKWEPLVRQAMARVGMLDPGALGDDAWSLFPVRHPAWRLRASLGSSAVDAHLAAKVLKRILSRNVTTEELRAQGSNLLTFPVPGEPGVSYAIPSDPSVPARDVTERDREMLELDLGKLAALRGKEMKLEGKPRVRADGASLFHGVLPAGPTSLHVFSLLRAPAGPAEREALVKDIAAEAFPGHAVLAVPRGRAWGSALFEVEYEGLVAGGVALVARAVKLARLEDEVDLWRLTDAPLVVHRKTRRVWFHATLMGLADSGYAMIEGLALQAGKTSSAREVCKWISRARDDLQAARSTRPKVVKWMIASFEGAGKSVEREEIERVVLVDSKGGYRLGVEVAVF